MWFPTTVPSTMILVLCSPCHRVRSLLGLRSTTVAGPGGSFNAELVGTKQVFFPYAS
jgi:hypothetical protein